MNLLQVLVNSVNTIYAKFLDNEEIENMPIYYIGGSSNLPPPLTPEEEETLLIELAREEKLETRQKLVERNLRLVVYIARPNERSKHLQYRKKHKTCNICFKMYRKWNTNVFKKE